jgi:ubiquinone/menaquinone biosynthesis C-methylase UbiE
MEHNTSLFDRKTISSAKRVILTPFRGLSTEERWELETAQVLSVLDEYLKRAHVVLDFGVGIGRISRAILEKYPNIKVIGVDSSEAMLDFCREYIPRKYFNEGRIQLYNFSQMSSIQTNSVDFILAIYVLQHVSMNVLGETLEHLQRILKPSGYLYVLNHYGRLSVDEDSHPTGYFAKWLTKIRSLPIRIPKSVEFLYTLTRIQRRFINKEIRRFFFNDGINLEHLLQERFQFVKQISFSNPYMQEVMSLHFSNLYVTPLESLEGLSPR